MYFRGKRTGTHKDVQETIFTRVGKTSGEAVSQNLRLDSKPSYTPESPCPLKIQSPTPLLRIFTFIIKLMLTIKMKHPSTLINSLHVCKCLNVKEREAKDVQRSGIGHWKKYAMIRMDFT